MKSLLEAPEYKFLVGKVIKELKFDEDIPPTEDNLGSGTYLKILFEDGTKITISDLANLCCEVRYMRTDDNLQDFIGETLLRIDVKDVGIDYTDSHDQSHEIQFVEVATPRGSFILSNHNVHNGYYSGFRVDITVIEEK